MIKKELWQGFLLLALAGIIYACKSDPFKGFTYSKRPADFGGMVSFYSMDGDFVNGWIYIEGTAYPVSVAN